MSDRTMELEVCTCCYLAAAGYSDHETGEDHEFCQHLPSPHDGAPLSQWPSAPAITPGGEDSDPEGEGDRAAVFSRRRCEGCGTPLAGERYWITVHGMD